MIILEPLVAEPAFGMKLLWFDPQRGSAVGGELIDHDAVALGDVIATELRAATRNKAGEANGDWWVYPNNTSQQPAFDKIRRR